MIDKAQEYVWATARVLEQRRFEFLFGDGGDPAAVRAALEPYKTADGGYGYALEPDGRGPTSQPRCRRSSPTPARRGGASAPTARSWRRR